MVCSEGHEVDAPDTCGSDAWMWCPRCEGLATGEKSWMCVLDVVCGSVTQSTLPQLQSAVESEVGRLTSYASSHGDAVMDRSYSVYMTRSWGYGVSVSSSCGGDGAMLWCMVPEGSGGVCVWSLLCESSGDWHVVRVGERVEVSGSEVSSYGSVSVTTLCVHDMLRGVYGGGEALGVSREVIRYVGV